MSGSSLSIFHPDLMFVNTPSPDAKPQKKRRRPALACEQCRKRKIRCDRSSPCNHCVKAGVSTCTYAPTHVPASRGRRSLARSPDDSARLTRPSTTTTTTVNPTIASASASTLPSPGAGRISLADHIRPYPVSLRLGGSSSSVPSSITGGSASDASNVEWLATRVHQLEEKLASVCHLGNQKDIAPSQGIQHGQHQSEQPQSQKGTVSKTRYFGQSHWINGIDMFSLEFKLLGRAEFDKSEVYQSLLKCKALSRRIKENRFKPVASDKLGKLMPSRKVADELVDTYLRTFEGVLRIVHVPTFRAEYNRYWQNPDAANLAFVIQTQLCMTIGATMLDENFSMRAMASKWIYEAQMWMMMPPEKSRMTIGGLQIECLLVLAKSTCGIGQDLTWITTGALIRKAMYMGLHRDPKKLAGMTRYRAEMRRRLWATVLELNLQAAFEAGGLPMISSADYDTLPPANLDDDRLTDEPDQDIGAEAEAETEMEMPSRPNPRAKTGTPTDMSMPLALFQSLPLRLSLLRHVNDFRSSESYDETLRLNSGLTNAARALSQTIATLTGKLTRDTQFKVTPFQISLAETFVYRCFQALHQGIIVQSLENPKFYFSRKMYLDSALKLSHIWGIVGSDASSTEPRPAAGSADFKRLVVNGSGMFRNVLVQALFIVAAELVQEGRGMSTGLGYLPAVHTRDLRACLDAASKWTIERVRAGETNAKGHIFTAACLAHIDALEAGLDQEGVEKAIFDGARESGKRCLEALAEVSRREGVRVENAGEEEEGEAGQGDDETAHLGEADRGAVGQDKSGTVDVDAGWMSDWAWDDDMEGFSWQQWTQLGGMDGMLSPLGPGVF